MNWLMRALTGFTGCGKSLSWKGTASQTAKKLSLEGHGFSRVPMSLRLTQGDENALNFS
jgi:hypothetical protein